MNETLAKEEALHKKTRKSLKSITDEANEKLFELSQALRGALRTIAHADTEPVMSLLTSLAERIEHEAVMFHKRVRDQKIVLDEFYESLRKDPDA
jgi:hypothetical protein